MFGAISAWDELVARYPESDDAKQAVVLLDMARGEATSLNAAVETGMARRAAERLLKRAERSGRVHRWSRDANRHVRFASVSEPAMTDSAHTP